MKILDLIKTILLSCDGWVTIEYLRKVGIIDGTSIHMSFSLDLHWEHDHVLESYAWQ